MHVASAKAIIAGAMSLALAAFIPFGVSADNTSAYADEAASVAIYRLYNPNTSEHFYTPNGGEKDSLASIGWKYEGIGWYAPVSGDEVYRLYSPASADHHYTMNAAERDLLVSHGWNYEGVCWHSGGNVPLYRQYNSHAKCGSHNYTTNAGERNMLCGAGWNDEGIGWYGVGEGVPAAVPSTSSTSSAQAPSQVNLSIPVGNTVYITNTGKKYHVDGCSSLRKSKHAISLSDAQARGYQPCRNCIR